MASKLKLKPLGGRVIVEPIEQEEMTAGGIILPETAKEKPQEGKILAAGPGDRDEDGDPVELRGDLGGERGRDLAEHPGRDHHQHLGQPALEQLPEQDQSDPDAGDRPPALEHGAERQGEDDVEQDVEGKHRHPDSEVTQVDWLLQQLRGSQQEQGCGNE